MAKGGKREGAGRPKGSINKASAELRAEIAASGLTPLEYMTKVYQDEEAEKTRRDDMAKAAAPYCHPRLQATEHTGKDGGPIEVANTDIKSTVAAVVSLMREAKLKG